MCLSSLRRLNPCQEDWGRPGHSSPIFCSRLEQHQFDKPIITEGKRKRQSEDCSSEEGRGRPGSAARRLCCSFGEHHSTSRLFFLLPILFPFQPLPTLRRSPRKLGPMTNWSRTPERSGKVEQTGGRNNKISECRSADRRMTTVSNSAWYFYCTNRSDQRGITTRLQGVL